MTTMVPIESNEFFIAFVISALIFLFACVAISTFITYLVLNKFINFGETECSIHQYSTDSIRYKVNTDNVLLDEKNEFFFLHGSDPYEGIEREIPEQLIKNGEKKAPHDPFI